MRIKKKKKNLSVPIENLLRNRKIHAIAALVDDKLPV